MADYERVREWIEKNVNPNRFKTLEAFIDKLESLPGVRDKIVLLRTIRKLMKINMLSKLWQI